MMRGTGGGWLADGLGRHGKVCDECGELFGGESAPGSSPGARPDVTRCPACRQRRLAARNERMLAAYASGPLGPRPARTEAPGSDAASAPLHDAVCAACGRPTRVPFSPRADRPVYCRPCHEAHHGR